MYLGVDYYPEHWDIKMIEEDMQRIKEMGANIIRIGEFAWHLMEPKEGEYDFSFFDKVISKAIEYDLKVMFGTPTATFPAWLTKKYPSILSEDNFGHKRVFGGRRQYCFNSVIYRQYTRKIIKELVSYYNKEEAIVVWQIDNELGHEGSDMCFCDNCGSKFHEFLKNKYINITELNKSYGTIFWGQTYNYFDEIPIPKDTITTHNPSLLLDWARFRSHSIIEYSKSQADLIKQLKGEHQEITHNFPGGFFEKFYDFNIVAKNLDFVSYDNYPVWGGLSKPLEPCQIAMSHDFIRGLKNKNYWIVEEIMGAQGHNVIGYLPRPNQAKMWAYHAVAHGCENILFFRWRGMTKGAEQFCQGIIDHDNKKGRKYYEAQKFIQDIIKYKDVIESKIVSDVALLYDYDNIWSWFYQQQSPTFDFTKEFLRLYKPFYSSNVNIDVVSSDKDFSKYKVIVLPVMQIINKELGNRLENFVKKGGVIIFSFRAGIKNKDNNIYYKQDFPCNIRDIAGITIKEAEPLYVGQEAEIIGVNKYKEKKGKCYVWRDLIITLQAKVLYRYDDFYKDKACITENQYGMGRVYYIGGGVDNEILDDIIEDILLNLNIKTKRSAKGLEVYTRDYNNKVYLFVINHSNQKLEFEDNIIEPYGVKIISDDFCQRGKKIWPLSKI